ncbi:MAG: DNA-3-methyladenine glycosylase 2 family protein [Steroidobacter sp.]
MATKIITLTARVKREAEMHLAQTDRVMAKLIATHGNCSIGMRKRDHFETLATSIISQQLSVKAADTIEKRVRALVKSFEPTEILAVAHENLRGAGLSNGKAKYLHALSMHIVDGRLDFDAFKKYPDDQVIAALTEVPGIGRWTAEMFLLFGLKRADVLAVGDVALQRAVRNLYGEKKTLEQVGRKWRPYASVASWYLWRSLEGK